MKTNIWKLHGRTSSDIPRLLKRYHCLNVDTLDNVQKYRCRGIISDWYNVYYYSNGYFIELLTKDHIKYNIFNFIDDYYFFKRKQKQLNKRFIEKTVSTCFLQEIVHDWIWVVK